jgi:hypothetical protein
MKRACGKLIQPAILFVAICVLASSASATKVVMLSDRNLALDSRVIVTGDVTSVMSAWDDTERVAWTYVEVQVDRILKGKLATSRVVLKQIGGTFGSGGMRVFGQPDFSQGQQVMLYLNTAPDGSLHVAHSFMGMFRIAEDSITGRKTVTRWDASAEVEISALRTVEPITDRAPLDEYLDNLQQTLQREALEVARIEDERRDRPVIAIPSEYKRVKRSAAAYSPSFVLIAGGLRWMEADSAQPITYYVNPANSPIAGGGSAELARAMSAWSQSGANIRLQVGGQTTRCGWEGDGSNTISFGDCRNQLDPPVGGCQGVIAATSVAYTYESRVVGGRTFNRITEADLVFNRGMDCFLGTSANLAECACHELGHSIGLDHSLDQSAIMWYAAHGGGFEARPRADDIAGVLAIYPSAGNPPPPTGGGPNDAAFVTQTAPTEMTGGQSYTVYVTMRNSGASTWLPSAGYRLGAQNPQDSFTWGLNRVSLPGPVAPASDVTFAFNVTAPAATGAYNFQWRMLQEGIGYFGPLSPNISITISGGGGGQGPVSITSVALAEGKVGRAYKQQLDALGGLQPYHWGLISGALPPGLSLSTSGAIVGTPTTSGNFDFGVQVFDFTSSPDKSDSKRLRITVTDPGAPPTPTISRVKVKALKKLFVYGANFSESSLIQLNGDLLIPKSVEIEGTSGTISFKGHLTLLPTGNNALVVLNGTTRSAAFFF